jgi:hypothetical protein
MVGAIDINKMLIRWGKGEEIEGRKSKRRKQDKGKEART